jgi:hypothetical protein
MQGVWACNFGPNVLRLGPSMSDPADPMAQATADVAFWLEVAQTARQVERACAEEFLANIGDDRDPDKGWAMTNATIAHDLVTLAGHRWAEALDQQTSIRMNNP